MLLRSLGVLFAIFVHFLYSNPNNLTNEILFEVQAKVSTNRILIGDKFKLHYTLTFHRKWKVAKPGPGLDLSPFEFLDYQTSPPTFEGDLVTSTITYELSIFEVGQFKLPAIFSSAIIEGKEVVLSSPPILITVLSTAENAKQENVFDIKGQVVPKGFIPLRYYVYLATFLCLILILVIVIYWWRRGKKKKEKELKAYEWALKEMRILKKEKLISHDEGKEFYYRFSLIVRMYLEKLEGFNYSSSTTKRIQKHLHARNENNDSYYVALFTHADKVKFARAKVSKTKLDTETEQFEDILRANRREDLAKEGEKKK